MIYLQGFSSVLWGRAKEILTHLNWVDLLGIIVVIRTFYSGIRRGLLIEIFKFSGFAVGIFFAVTQYRTWGAVLSERNVFPLREAEIFAGVAIFTGVYGASFLLRLLFVKVATVQIRGAWDRIGGGVLGFCRGCLWMIFLEVTALCLSQTTGYLTQSIRERSFFGPSLLKGGEMTYQIANHASSSFAIEKFEKILQEEFPPSPQKHQKKLQ